MKSFVKSELIDGIYHVTMDRPDKKNAINSKMYIELKEALKYADEKKDVKAILLSGEGGSFTSGNDLSDFLDFQNDAEKNPAMQFINTIANLKKPVVASVEGLAIGIGVTMILHCDLVVASKNTLFQMPFVSLGLCPEAGSTFLLPLLVGYHNAAKLMLLADTFTAEEAYSLGIVNFLVEEDELKAFSVNVAKRIAEKPINAVLTTKSLLKTGFKQQLSLMIREESKAFLSMLKTDEVSDKIKEFLNKKK